jgi:hypothetical protein
MKRIAFVVLLFALCHDISAQDFPFGKVTASDLTTRYSLDTTASAIVVDEFGSAHIENGGDYNLLFSHHFKIKILKKDGLDQGSVIIPLRISDSRKELLRSVQASSFNIGTNGLIEERKLEDKLIFKEKQVDKYHDAVKFTLPSVTVGTIIEVAYTIESPFIYNFRRWEFQSDIPKLRSEFWATIPGNYTYNISLKGFQKLHKNESELIKACFTPSGNSADCSRHKYAMQNIPAFKEEEYMTAASNFISSVNFELQEIFYFDGRKDKITKEWKDVDYELKKDESFGVQLKRSEKEISNRLDPAIMLEADALNKARKIYSAIQGTLLWNETYGMFGENGAKKNKTRKCCRH